MNKLVVFLTIILLFFTFYYYLEKSGITGFAVLTKQAILETVITDFQVNSANNQCSSLLEGIIVNKGNIPAENLTLFCRVDDREGKDLGNGTMHIDEILVGEKYFSLRFDTACTAAMAGKTYSCNMI